MRSRVARLSCGLMAIVVMAAAAFFLFNSERRIAEMRTRVRAFDLSARDVSASVADLRAAQQAYVAAGQGVGFWMPRVAELTSRTQESLNSLLASTTAPAARQALDEASATLAEFGDIDKRARDYVRTGQPLMAGDVIFTEGADAASRAGRSVESARLAEHGQLDADEAAARRYEAAALGGAAGLAGITLLVLGLVPPREAPEAVDAPIDDSRLIAPTPVEPVPSPRPVSPILKTAAQLCTDFGAAQDDNDLRLLLSRFADIIDASGVVVWLSTADGTTLRPVLTHGYSKEAIARLPAVPRSADNAAAAAFRTGELQIVPSTPGGPTGAVVAPIVSARGCVGALSAEIREGGEGSESVDALMTILASQLAGVVAGPTEEVNGQRAAL